jgi:protein phosphatase 1L
MTYLKTSLLGKRKTNEDEYIIEDYDTLKVFGIFDGHGGDEISRYLKKNLIRNIINKGDRTVLTTNRLEKSFENTQYNIIKRYPKISRGTGSTALILFIKKERLTILNLGDCRAVISYNGNAQQITEDHKPHTNKERRRIEKLNGKITWDGFDWRIQALSVSRAFGDTDTKRFVIQKPDIFRHTLRKGDEFIILACDGLWDVLSNKEAVNFVIKNRKKRGMTKLLAEYAIEKGSTDNITVIVIFFK